MTRRRSVTLPFVSHACALLLFTRVAGGDPSPHHVSLVTIRSEVRLEVLDWGGRGPALVFLAGYGDTAHVFDDFAPRFTGRFHVLGITRRGFGASTRPQSGYDTATLAEDITRALDSLGIRRAAFVAHSFGGSELNYLGAFHPDRVTRLVYLDASYDFAGLSADPRWQRAFPIPRPPLPTTGGRIALVHWYSRVLGPRFPASEVGEMNRREWQDLEQEIKRGEFKVDRSRIRAPVLALWADPGSVQEQYPYWAGMSAVDRSRLQASFALSQSVRHDQLAAFRREVPDAKIVLVPAGRHFLFLSQPGLVADAMRTFLSGSIAFVSDRDGSDDIFVMAEDGSDPVNLTHGHTGHDSYPAWSPDCRHLIFNSDRDGPMAVYAMTREGKQLRRLTGPRASLRPSWSPDGRFLAFVEEDASGTGDIMRSNADGSQLINLTRHPAVYGAPAWSPDGKQLAFHSSRDGDVEIYAMLADGSALRRLTNSPKADVEPAWSPPGTRIAFASFRNGKPDIYLMQSDGSELRRLTTDSTTDYHPAWSPDGRWIAFHSSRDGNAEI